MSFSVLTRIQLASTRPRFRGAPLWVAMAFLCGALGRAPSQGPPGLPLPQIVGTPLKGLLRPEGQRQSYRSCETTPGKTGTLLFFECLKTTLASQSVVAL